MVNNTNMQMNLRNNTQPPTSTDDGSNFFGALVVFIMDMVITILSVRGFSIVTAGLYLLLLKIFLFIHKVFCSLASALHIPPVNAMPRPVRQALNGAYLLLLSPLILILICINCMRSCKKNIFAQPQPLLRNSKIAEEIQQLGLSDKIQSISIPPYYKCAISLDLMQNPVINAAGHTYERACLIEWYSQHDSDPGTNLQLDPLTEKGYWPNKIMEDQIVEFLHLVANGEYTNTEEQQGLSSLGLMQNRLTFMADSLKANFSNALSYVVNPNAENSTTVQSQNNRLSI